MRVKHYFVIFFVIHHITPCDEVGWLNVWNHSLSRLDFIFHWKASLFLQHECQIWATRVGQERHEYKTSKTRAKQVRQECDMKATRTTRVRHEWKILVFITKRFNETLTIFKRSFKTNERLQGVKQYHSRNYLLEVPRSHAKMHLKSSPQKLNFVIAKAVLKRYTLDCGSKYPCTFPHSYTTSFLIKPAW